MSRHVGDAGAEPETENGRHLHTLLRDLQLRLPRTFAAVVEAPHHTWVSPRGTSGRIDFVAVPQEWLMGVRREWVAADMVVGAVRHDHMAAAVQLTLEGRAWRAPRRRRER